MQAEPRHLLEQRNHDDLLGQGHRADEQTEDEVAARKLLFRQRVTAHRAAQARQQHRHAADEHGIEHPRPRGAGEELGVVIQRRVGGEENGRARIDGARVFNRAGYDPVQREEHHQREDDEQRDADDAVRGQLFLRYDPSVSPPYSFASRNCKALKIAMMIARMMPSAQP